MASKHLIPVLKVAAEVRPGEWADMRFERQFRIGRLKECDLCIESTFVSRTHAGVEYVDDCWTIRDLGSSNGIFYLGERLPSVRIADRATIRLGVAGPEIRFEVELPPPPPPSVERRKKDKDASLAPYIARYFSKPAANEPAGDRTRLIRLAYAHVETKKNRKSGVVIGALLCLTLVFGLFAYYQYRQLSQQRTSAQELFYAIKAQDVDLANLNRALAATNSQIGLQEMDRYRNRRQEMEKSYDHYLATLNIYSPKLTERQRLIMRVARIFGECELDMPPDFEAEINRYIDRWKSTGRFKNAIQVAQQNGYIDTISHELLNKGLPPQFFYLALQESNMNVYAVGPITRKGYAKGMWQFIPETAVKYGLHLGPLVDQPRPDPADERHNYKKATDAASQYLLDLYSTDAQASGLLVMACYNWGEKSVLPLVQSMPANPRERNFWKLLSKHRDQIPQETYDYVFSITSAAVIGENPRLFGFDFDNPLAGSGTVGQQASENIHNRLRTDSPVVKSHAE